MGVVPNVEVAGGIVRRIREDAGMSRSKLAQIAGISPRSLYALEMGESENFGLGNYLRVLKALGLSMDVGVSHQRKNDGGTEAPQVQMPEFPLGDRWGWKKDEN